MSINKTQMLKGSSHINLFHPKTFTPLQSFANYIFGRFVFREVGKNKAFYIVFLEHLNIDSS